MKPVETPNTAIKFVLEDGNEENILPCEQAYDANENSVLLSTWEPNEEERKAISEGKNIELLVWGTGHPPVAMRVAEVEESNEANA